MTCMDWRHFDDIPFNPFAKITCILRQIVFSGDTRCDDRGIRLHLLNCDH